MHNNVKSSSEQGPIKVSQLCANMAKNAKSFNQNPPNIRYTPSALLASQGKWHNFSSSSLTKCTQGVFISLDFFLSSLKETHFNTKHPYDEIYSMTLCAIFSRKLHTNSRIILKLRSFFRRTMKNFPFWRVLLNLMGIEIRLSYWHELFTPNNMCSIASLLNNNCNTSSPIKLSKGKWDTQKKFDGNNLKVERHIKMNMLIHPRILESLGKLANFTRSGSFLR